MVEGILFIGGKSPKKSKIESLIEKASYIVAADSGYDYARKNGIIPDMVVGDMDSIQNPDVLKNLPETKIKRYDRDKDKTDTELGLDILWKWGTTRITIIGGGGGRLDHLFGLFTLFERDKHPFQWFTHRSRVIHIDTFLSLKVEKGETLSFFPIGETRSEMTSEGLKWSLDSICWNRGDMGLSNEAMKNVITVTMKKGRLLLIKEIGREHIIE